MQLPAIIIVILPVVTPFIGSSLAAILAQDHWPAWTNDTIAWLVLLAFSGLDMWANGQFSSGWLEIAADAIQALTLLSSGWLVKLGPWLVWLNWLQSNVFNLLPLFEDIEKEHQSPPPANANPVRVPTAIPFPPNQTAQQ